MTFENLMQAWTEKHTLPVGTHFVYVLVVLGPPETIPGLQVYTSSTECTEELGTSLLTAFIMGQTHDAHPNTFPS